ncbi:MAG TPA: hypothetical protein V6D22_02700 [Candidatus Obscuribacterales bacterium]
MKNAFAAALFATVMTAGAALAQGANEGPRYAFDAYYLETPSNANIHMLSDGQGKLRTEVEKGGQKSVTVSDFANQVGYQIVDPQRMVLRYRLRPGAGHDVHDDASARRLGAKGTGVQIMHNHACHVWEYAGATGKTTTWVADDVDYLVRSQTTTPNGQSYGLDLKMITRTNPSPSLFAVPAGYKIVNVQTPGR